VLDGLIKVGQNAQLQEFGTKADAKVIKRHGSIRMTRGAVLQSRSILFHVV
jgi:hypothetical protein